MKLTHRLYKVMAFVLGTSSAQGTIVRTLSEENVITVPLSLQDHTRIKVEGDRIVQVFGNAGEYVLETDETQGQVFIRPHLPKDGSKTLSLTLITEKGHTQDLRLLPQDKPSETILLKSAKENPKGSSPCISRQDVEDLLKAAQEERIPLGYKALPLNAKSLQGTYKLVRALQGKSLCALTYEVDNSRPLEREQTLLLSAPLFTRNVPPAFMAGGTPLRREDIMAIFIPKPLVYSGERSQIYVVTRTP